MRDVEILHHGAFEGVTGSCHELRLPSGDGVLVDCGLFQGAEATSSGGETKSSAIEFPIEQVKALVVTHTHIDH
jgi:metallo-beta-lactamase family protein